jgi:hypothetical protein
MVDGLGAESTAKYWFHGCATAAHRALCNKLRLQNFGTFIIIKLPNQASQLQNFGHREV